MKLRGRALEDAAARVARPGKDLIPTVNLVIVRRIARVIDESGIVDEIMKWEAEAAAKRHPGGRPRQFGFRSVLILMLLLAHQNVPLKYVNAETLMTRKVSRATRLEFGWVPTRRHARTMWAVRRTFARLCEYLDSLPIPNRRRRYEPDGWEAVLAERATHSDELDERRRRVDWLANRLVRAPHVLMDDRCQAWDGSLALDATPFAAYGAGRKNDSVHRRSIEPDAGWYVRQGKHKYDADKAGLKKSIWGWEVELGVMVSQTPGSHMEYPKLIMAINMHKPGTGSAKRGIDALRLLRADGGFPAGHLLTDRLYAPNSKPANFQLPARDLGYKLWFDYGKKQLGLKRHNAGAILVEGTWYCRELPENLITATRDFRKERIDEETYRDRIAERVPYELRRKDTSSHGHAIVQCPAAGVCPVATCTVKKNPTGIANANARLAAQAARNKKELRPLLPIIVRNDTTKRLAETTGNICGNKNSTTIPLEVGAKFEQEYTYQGPQWRAWEGRRNTIEGFNGDVKTNGLAAPTRRPARGFTAQYLLLSLLVTAENIRRVDAFKNANDPIDPTLAEEIAEYLLDDLNWGTEYARDAAPLAGAPPDERALVLA